MSLLSRIAFSILLAAAVPAFAFAQTPPDATPDLRPEMFESGQWLPGHVVTSARQRDGKLLIGGSFDRVAGGAARHGLLRLNADGSLDAGFAPVFASQTALEVAALAVAGDAIYAGGLFETVDGLPRASIVKLHLDGSVDAAWTSPFASTSANEVAAIVATAAGVFVGGDLLDHDAYGLVRLDPATGAYDPSWAAPTRYAPGSASRGEVFALAAVGGDLLVGGEFGEIAGVARQSIARISQSAPVAVRTLVSDISGEVHAFALAGRSAYVGGNFFGNAGPDYLMRIDVASGAVDLGWQPATFGAVFALHLVADTLYVGGSFVAAAPGGARLVRVATRGDGSVDPSWNPLAEDAVLTIADSCHGRLVVGGNFTTLSGQTRDGFAAFTIPELDCLFADGFDPG
ncbi:MAG TPA: delta-60 repeat domain-containing protein [Dokdonella sp.]